MNNSRETPKVNFTKVPETNKNVTYEEIRKILLRRHNNDRIGDNDTM